MHGQPEESCGAVHSLSYALVAQQWGDAAAAERRRRCRPPRAPPVLPAGPGSAAGGRGVEVASGSGTSSAGGIEDGSEGAVELAASRAGLSTHEYQSGTGVEPDAEGEADGALFTPVDLACVVVRAFAPFRTRMPAMGGRPARFRRARWLRVLPADGGEPLPVLLYAHHVPSPPELAMLFPEEPTGPEPPTRFPLGTPLVLRNLTVVDAGLVALPGGGSSQLGLGPGSGSGSGSRPALAPAGRAPPPTSSFPRPGDNSRTVGDARVGSGPACAARGRYAARGEAVREGGCARQTTAPEVFDEVSAMWLAEGRQTWKSALRADLLPARGAPRAVE